MHESNTLKMLSEAYAEKGREGLLPCNLSDTLLERMAANGELDDRERRNVVSAAVSLFMYGHMKVSELARDEAFHEATIPYLMNILLENHDRENWVAGIVHATAEDVFDLERIAIRFNNQEWSLTQALYSPPKNLNAPKAQETDSEIEVDPKEKLARSLNVLRGSHASIRATVLANHLDALQELDEIFKSHIKGSRHLLSGYRSIFPLQKDEVDYWQFVWDDCHLFCDRRVIAQAVKKWGKAHYNAIEDLEFNVQNLVELTFISKKDLRGGKK